MSQFNMKMQYYKGLSQKPNIIVSCISGEGIAVEIKEILSRYVNTDEIDIYDRDLTFKGLKHIYEKYTNEKKRLETKVG